jgi:hypothetical protein
MDFRKFQEPASVGIEILKAVEKEFEDVHWSESGMIINHRTMKAREARKR